MMPKIAIDSFIPMTHISVSGSKQQSLNSSYPIEQLINHILMKTSLVLNLVIISI